MSNPGACLVPPLRPLHHPLGDGKLLTEPQRDDNGKIIDHYLDVIAGMLTFKTLPHSSRLAENPQDLLVFGSHFRSDG
jgi:hypothetical protein